MVQGVIRTYLFKILEHSTDYREQIFCMVQVYAISYFGIDMALCWHYSNAYLIGHKNKWFGVFLDPTTTFISFLWLLANVAMRFFVQYIIAFQQAHWHVFMHQ